jgi:hypothetical protein
MTSVLRMAHWLMHENQAVGNAFAWAIALN